MHVLPQRGEVQRPCESRRGRREPAGSPDYEVRGRPALRRSGFRFGLQQNVEVVGVDGEDEGVFAFDVAPRDEFGERFLEGNEPLRRVMVISWFRCWRLL